VTYEDLAKDAGVSRQTVMNLLRRLQDDGVVSRAHGEVPEHPRSDGFWLRGDDE
jgi:DNA-binding Lrp family transcriptional regulator